MATHRYVLAEKGKVTWSQDRLLFFLDAEDSKIALEHLAKANYHVIDGDVGFGLYQNKDKTERCLAEPGVIKIPGGYKEGWWFNPSMLYYIPFKE